MPQDEFTCMMCLAAAAAKERAPRPQGLARGTESKEAEAALEGYSRRVTPLAFIHRRVRPLDGWMVVANPYHLGQLFMPFASMRPWPGST